MKTKTLATGLSLIELMIALAIISILSALSFPAYTHHVAHAKRVQAEVILMQLAAALEQFYVENNTYQNASLSALHFSPDIAHGRYQLAIAEADNSHYTLKAIPLGSQARADSACGILTINSVGEKNNSGAAKVEECW